MGHPCGLPHLFQKNKTMKAKPFIKWVGGKSQLIEQLEDLLPADFDKWENVTNIEFLNSKL